MNLSSGCSIKNVSFIGASQRLRVFTPRGSHAKRILAENQVKIAQVQNRGQTYGFFAPDPFKLKASNYGKARVFHEPRRLRPQSCESDNKCDP